MFRNHLKFTLRNLLRHKVYAGISILGLMTALTCILIILLWVGHELSYDRFHRNADNIYLVLRGEKDSFMAPTSKLLAPVLKTDLPEVINSTCFTRIPGSEKYFVRYGDKCFEENISLADSHFFEIFSFPLLKGNPATALEGPSSVLITEKTAQKFFGNNPSVGETVQMYMFGKKIDMKITGVLADIPANSFFKSDMFIHHNALRQFGINLDRWDNQTVNTYVLIQEGSDIQNLSNKIRDCEIRNHPGARFGKLTYDILSLTKIHLYSKNIRFLTTTGDIKYIYIFCAAALIILLIASINYMNLSTALSLRRTKEIGVRKVAGASRNSLMRQFLGETMILSFVSLILAVLLTQLFLPSFNQIFNKSLSIPYFDPSFILGAILIAVITSVLSGYYPALFLSAFQPLVLMKTKSSSTLKGSSIRKGLLVFQFSLSILLIISTIVVFNQLVFIRNSSVGYDKDNILCVKIHGNINHSYEALKNDLLDNPDILSVSRSEPLDVNVLTNTDGVYWKSKRRNEGKDFRILRTDYDFLSTYGIEMDEGRFYSKKFKSDQTDAYVINKTAAKTMEMESPVGEEIRLWRQKGLIIGVVKDFIFGSFHSSIEPLIITIPSEQYKDIYLRLLSIRFRPEKLLSSIKYIENRWMEIFPDIPFDYFFLDDALNSQYQAEEHMGILFKYFTVLAILIASLGIYGLTALSAEQKIKEIGIRKVLGASVPNIAVLLSKEYLSWVLLANLFAWPTAWFVMSKWLQNFAYRTSINWWIFILVSGIGFVIALLTVSSLAIRAALKNPVESLRYE